VWLRLDGGKRFGHIFPAGLLLVLLLDWRRRTAKLGLERFLPGLLGDCTRPDTRDRRIATSGPSILGATSLERVNSNDEFVPACGCFVRERQT
jgi:hypothetical protein